ncbi:MAG: apolipoprotein N-acyltransferase [Methylophilus sp.]
MIRIKKEYLTVFLAGVLMVLGFAPFYLFPAPIISLIILFNLWHQSKSAKRSFKLGLSFGLGLYGAGIYWIYICLHTFGGMPWWFAGFSTLCLCAFMALFPAIVGYFSHRLGFLLWSAPVLWGLSDWVRGWIFTGFPWLTLGYSQVPHSPLVGYMPIVGVYGVSVIVALVASIVAHWWFKKKKAIIWTRNALAGIVIILVTGLALKAFEWTNPVGQSFNVALLQGNVNQLIKWSPDMAQKTIDLYLNMVKKSQAKLVVLPETALPVLASQLAPEVKTEIIKYMRAQLADAIVGMVEFNEVTNEYFNSALSYGMSPTQAYSKRHLVPFGEFIPFKQVFGWVYRDWLNMPLSDLSRGVNNAPMEIAGQRVAVNICYEDVFGEEIIRMLPSATILVNISNDAWYGQSFAADQHMQFSQARAIETGRMVLRSTNTGATAIIDNHGVINAHAPHDEIAILTGHAQGFEGITPYVRWGNWPFVLMSFAIIGLLLRRRKHVPSQT